MIRSITPPSTSASSRLLRVSGLAIGSVAAVTLLVSGCSSSSSSDTSSSDTSSSDTSSSDTSTSTTSPSSAATSSPNGEPTASISKELPPQWPSDVPAPAGLNLANVTSTELAGEKRYMAVYEGTTPQAAVVAQMSKDLKNAGFTQSNKIDGPAVIMNWTKPGMRVGVNVATTDDKNPKTIATVTVVPQ